MEDRLAREELSVFLKSGIYRFENSNFIFIDPVRVLNRSYSRSLNEKERAADQRHQVAKRLLLKAHESLLHATDLLGVMSSLNREFGSSTRSRWLELPKDHQSLIEHGRVWQAPLYKITLKLPESDQSSEFGGSSFKHRVVPLFITWLSIRYVTRWKLNFLIINIHCLVKVASTWYPTLPNWYFLALLIKKLSHSNAALVALWLTSREKFHHFIDLELFPSWGITHISTCYWLKDIEDLKNWGQTVPKDQIIICIPRDYSRKPPIGELLQNYVPGSKPGHCIELFAREMNPGWLSWGNEPHHFQESQHFTRT